MKVKKMISLLLVLAMLAGLMPVFIFAEEGDELPDETAFRNGSIGTDISYSWNLNGLLTISGEGAIPDYSEDDPAPWLEWADEITGLSFEGNITQIGDYSFYGCDNVTGDLLIPDSVESIGDYAFCGCSGLEGRLVLPDSLQSIGRAAFYGCSGFNGKLVVPDSVNLLHAGVFGNMSGITELVLGPEIALNQEEFSEEGMREEDYPFYGMSSVSAVTFTGNVPPNLTDVEGLKWPMSLFAVLLYQMESIHTIFVPASAYADYVHAFAVLDDSDKNVAIKTIGNENEDDFTISDGVLVSYHGTDTEVVIPDSVETIGEFAFYQCADITSVTFPLSVKEIGPYAFYGCSSLETLSLPNNLTHIREGAFLGLENLAGSLLIPDSVQEIGDRAFAGCALTELSLGFGVQAIGEYAFAYNPIVGTLDIPDGVKQIGKYAFVRCDGLTGTLNIPGSVQSIGDYAFQDCKSITEVRMNDGLESIGDAAFYNCNSLECILEIPGSVKKVGNSAFYNCKNLMGIVMHNGLQEIGPGAFVGCDKFTGSLSIPNSVNRIGREAFRGCSQLSGSLIIPDGVSEIEDGAFSGCSHFTSVVIGNGLQTIGGSQTFSGMGGVRTITFKGTVVPDVSGDEATLFDSMDALEIIYVPRESHDEYEEQLTKYLPDNVVIRSVPSPIEGVMAISDENAIYLTWAISVEADTTRYNIYRRSEDEEEFELIRQIESRNTLSYKDSDVTEDHIYYYYVVGVDSYDVESSEYVVVDATLMEDQVPPTVTRLSPSNGSYLSGEQKIEIHAEDNVVVGSSALYYSLDKGETWNLLEEQEGEGWSTSLDTSELPDGEIRIKGIAEDFAGNVSDGLTYTYFLDNTGPEKVEGLSWESTSVTATLRWNDVADEDIAFFRVEIRNDDGNYEKIDDVTNTLGINIGELQPGNTYTYRVVGYDLHNNRGVPSEDIAVLTKDDTTAPVVTRIRPLSGYYNDSIPVTLTAKDEHGVQNILLQVSDDGLYWEDVSQEQFDEIQTERSMNYDLSLDGYDEGSIYIRGVATDFAGNVSNTEDTAPFVEHIVDRTPPSAPENISASGEQGHVEVGWTQGQEKDLDSYTVWRAEAAEGPYSVISSGIRYINYIDRSITEGTQYWYYVTVCDKAGNVSQASEKVSAKSLEDEEIPQIVSIYPETGRSIGEGYHSISILARDNQRLNSIEAQYSSDDTSYNLLKRFDNLDTYSTTVQAEIPLDEFEHGEKVYLKIKALDASGLESEEVKGVYSIDLEAPSVAKAKAKYDDEVVVVQWESGMEDDLIGYRIYRQNTDDDERSLIAQKQSVEEQKNYTVYDYNLPSEKGKYVYTIEAVDACGNTNSVNSPEVEVPDRSTPIPMLSCESVMEEGVEYIVDASASSDNSRIVSYHIDFGDGTTSNSSTPKHIYRETGEYTIVLKVKDDEGNEAVLQKRVTVKERALLGTIRVHIFDEYGNDVPNAPVYFDLGSTGQVVRSTDTNGNVWFTAEAGRHVIGCVIANNEWLPAKKEVVVTAGEESAISMTLVHQTMIEGQFEVNRMTFDEIQAAGIDPAIPENQHIVQVNVSLIYGSEIIEDSFKYNESNGEVISEPKIVTTGNGEKRRLIPSVIITGGGGSGGSGGIGSGTGHVSDSLKDITIAYLDIPIEGSFLKEFFDVKLHIINNASSQFRMVDNMITLNVPEGLSLVELEGSEGSVVSIPEISGQTTKTINWILRGDEEGAYSISADYSGVIGDFNEPIQTRFVSEEPIEVFGLSALKLTAEINTSIRYDGFYFNLSIQNKGNVDMYLPSVDVMGGTISSYLKEAGKTEPNEEKTPQVVLLNKVLSNSLGYSQYIGKDQIVNSLSPGMSLTHKYVVYNATGFNNKLFLENAVHEIITGSEIEFEILESDMDLFAMDYPLEKVKDIVNKQESKDAYDEIIDLNNFSYYRKAIDNENLSVDLQEMTYDIIKGFLEVDVNISVDEVKELTRKTVVQLLEDEAMQEAIETKMGAKELEIVSGVLKAMYSLLKTDGYDEDANVILGVLESEEGIRKFTQKIFGYSDNEIDSMLYRFVHAFDSTLLSTLAREKIMSYYGSGGKFEKLLFNKTEEQCEEIVDFIDILSQSLTAWEESHELMTELIRIASTQEEADALLGMLLEFVPEDSPVHDELVDIQDDMDKAEKRMKAELSEKLVKIVASELGEEAIKESTKVLGLYTVFKLAKIGFSLADYVFDFSGTMKDIHTLRVQSIISYALRNAADKYGTEATTDEEALFTLKALKYLIKMHSLGELSLVETANAKEGYRNEILGEINSQQPDGNKYNDLDDYLNDILHIILNDRDLLFSSYYTNLSIPDAPVVTLNYISNKTNEFFSDEYEYSFDHKNWNECNGEISFIPGNKTQHLLVRKAETNENAAGNVTTVIISSKPFIQGDLTAEYDGVYYHVHGLKAGKYRYTLTDSKEETELSSTVTVGSDGSFRIKSTGKKNFVAIQSVETSNSPASMIRYMSPENVDPKTVQIVGNPENVMALIGEQIHFSVKAEGSELLYRWQYQKAGTTAWKNSGLEGSTSETITVPVAEVRDGQKYRCVVTDVYGHSATSSSATLTAIVPLSLETNPESMVQTIGQTAIFTVKATGSNLQYQWQYYTESSGKWKNSGMTGSNTDTIQVPVTEARNGQKYRCVITGGAGETITSKEAMLTAIEPLSITSQPANVSVKIGKTAVFAVEATGSKLSYQWQYYGSGKWRNSSLSGNQTKSVSVEATEKRNGQQYRCVVSDGYRNSEISSVAVLTAKPVLIITKQPVSEEVLVGKNASFTVKANGSGMAYQWQYRTGASGTWKDSGMTGSATDTITIPVLEKRDGQRYRCIVTDDDGDSVISDEVILTAVVPLSITAQPEDISVKDGELASFTVKAAGRNLAYQWQYLANGVWKNSSMDGNDSATVRVPAAEKRNGQRYRCIVSDGYGNAETSEEAALTVVPRLAIKTQPGNVTISTGQTATFTVKATGTDLTYQWQYYTESTGKWRDSGMEGSDTATIKVPVTEKRNGQKYRCIVTDADGDSLTSKAAVLTAVAPITITSQPKNVTIMEDHNATFTVKAAGSNLSYKWQYYSVSESKWKDSGMEGNRTDTVTVPAIEKRNGQKYRCMIWDDQGNSIVSSVAILTVSSFASETTSKAA